MNLWDVLILGLVASAVVLALLQMWKNRRRNGGCSCGCSDCEKSCQSKQDFSKK